MNRTIPSTGAPVILGQGVRHPADATELRVPDAAAATALLAAERPDCLDLINERCAGFGRRGAGAQPDTTACRRALQLGLARMGERHGSWSSDFHHYHNENHALELLDGRIDRLRQCPAADALDARDWMALWLFAACHDLRQRETVDFSQPVGNNEAASVAETFRILDACGYDRSRDADQYVALELMIAGSTFDPRPAADREPYNSAEAATTGGALAPELPRWLDAERRGWRGDPHLARGVELALIAADLDTANVGEPFEWLCESASRLCQEREMRSGRNIATEASVAPCIEFLSGGQRRYFFELHRFSSAAGEEAFGARKRANAAPLLWAAEQLPAAAMAAHVGSGLDVLRVHSRLCLEAAGRVLLGR